MTQQQMQYAYFERQRRQAMLRNYLQIKQQNIQYLRSYILAGGDPMLNPFISAEYELLWQESDGSYFTFEDGNTELSGYGLLREK